MILFGCARDQDRAFPLHKVQRTCEQTAQSEGDFRTAAANHAQIQPKLRLLPPGYGGRSSVECGGGPADWCNPGAFDYQTYLAPSQSKMIEQQIVTQQPRADLLKVGTTAD